MMKHTQTHKLMLATLCAVLMFVAGCKSTDNASAPGTEQAIKDAVDVYIYGYPLVTMDMTRKQMTNVAETQGTHAPMGQLVRMRHYPDANFKTVTAPNADTLYTTAWLDVSGEPWIFSVPNMGDRFYLLPMLDGWTNVFQVPGKRTTGGKAQTYAITGPGWSGALPTGVTELKSPTGMVWILGRIYCDGTPADYAKVHAVQDRFSLVPLSSYGKPYKALPGEVDANFDMQNGVRDQVDAFGVDEYFDYLAKLMKTNPPAASDAPILAKMAAIGVVPGKDFDPSKLGAFDKEAIKAVPKLAQVQIMEHFKKAGEPVNGWIFTTNAGTYGTDYLQRALITTIGLGANRPQDAVYPTGDKDGQGNKFDASSKNYVMHFDKGQFPPVNGFWSLTMYDDKYFFVDNPLNRYTLSERNKFITNPDGSVDLYLQADSPGKAKEANWLPAPKGKFVPMLRLYWPKDTPPSIIDGSWKPPAINVAQ
jgi:hypothetical protein